MTGHLERHLSRDPLRAVLNLFWNRISEIWVFLAGEGLVWEPWVG